MFVPLGLAFVFILIHRLLILSSCGVSLGGRFINLHVCISSSSPAILKLSQSDRGHFARKSSRLPNYLQSFTYLNETEYSACIRANDNFVRLIY